VSPAIGHPFHSHFPRRTSSPAAKRHRYRPADRIAAVAITGLNRVDFFQVGGTGQRRNNYVRRFTAPVNVPTSVSINHTLHQVSVISFKDQSSPSSKCTYG